MPLFIRSQFLQNGCLSGCRNLYSEHVRVIKRDLSIQLLFLAASNFKLVSRQRRMGPIYPKTVDVYLVTMR